MARDLFCRLHLCGTLVTQSPLHVGGHGDDVDTDLPLARNGAGELYIPGTSLAGALRELAERLFGENMIDDLWGFQDGDGGHASFVLVENAVIESADSVVVEIRDHVGIDREYGAAAEHIKYDRAILPRGTKLQLRLTVEVANQEKRNQALAMVATLKEALEAGEVRLGAAKTRGLGHVQMEDGSKLTEQGFSSRQDILNLLRQANGVAVSQTELDAAKQAHPPRQRPRLKFTIHWKPVGPLMVKAGFDGIAADMLPLVSGCDDGQVALVLPGSSVKGAFRNQAERIVRTVLGNVRPNWLDTEGKKKFLDAVKLSLIDELFGRTGEKVGEDEKRICLPGLGALGVMDCFGQHRLTVAQWQAIQAATADQQLRQSLTAAGLQPWSQAYHVAIDRWLGSAAESMLYTVLEPHRTDWEPLTLEVNLQRLPDDLCLPCLALLLLVIRELANDRLPLGFATHRGMGTVRVEKVEIQGMDLPDSLRELDQATLPGGRLTGLSAGMRQKLTCDWKQWIAKTTQHQEVPA